MVSQSHPQVLVHPEPEVLLLLPSAQQYFDLVSLNEVFSNIQLSSFLWVGTPAVDFTLMHDYRQLKSESGSQKYFVCKFSLRTSQHYCVLSSLALETCKLWLATATNHTQVAADTHWLPSDHERGLRAWIRSLSFQSHKSAILLLVPF